MLPELEQLKELWQLCFGDSREYADFFFGRAYRPEGTRTRVRDGKIVSAAQFFHFDITNGPHLLKSAYILGVCTHPDYRRQGLSGSIIRQILTEQADAGMDLAFLIPSAAHLFTFYEKLGFSGVFTAYEDFLSPVKPDKPYEQMNPSVDALYDFYDKFHRSLPSAVIKDRDYFNFAIDDFAQYGQIHVCGVNGDIYGFAAVDGDVVKELLYLDTNARDTLLSTIRPTHSRNSIRAITPTFSPTATKRTIGMAHILNPQAPTPTDSYANLLLN